MKTSPSKAGLHAGPAHRRPAAARTLTNASWLLMIAGCVLATDGARAQMQDGWTAASIAGATEDCGQRMMAIARETFAHRGAARGGDLPSAFPEEHVRRTNAAMCRCVVDLAAARVPLADWQANLEHHLASLSMEAFASGNCKPISERAGRMEGGTSRSMQEDFDRIRLDHALTIAALVDEYRAKAGAFPFADGADSVPAAVVIATEQQDERNKDIVDIRVDLALRATNDERAPRFERIEVHTMKAFEDELSRVLGRPVQLPVDPQQIPLNKPSVYVYVVYRGIYDVSAFLHQEFPFARPLGPYYNKVAIASRSHPGRGFWTAEDLKKQPQFVEFFSKPFNGERYTLKTKL